MLYNHVCVWHDLATPLHNNSSGSWRESTGIDPLLSTYVDPLLSTYVDPLLSTGPVTVWDIVLSVSQECASCAYHLIVTHSCLMIFTAYSCCFEVVWSVK